MGSSTDAAPAAHPENHPYADRTGRRETIRSDPS